MTAARGLICLLATGLLGACSGASSEDVAGFSVEYSTGSIPPPGNYTYRIEGVPVEDGGLTLDYALTYRHREDMTDEELAARGYGPNDDLTWTTTINGAQADAWLDLAAQAELRDAESLPGGDSMQITVRLRSGSERSGSPTERDAWEALADALDLDARAALDHPRPGR
jgi:hypothetical protein